MFPESAPTQRYTQILPSSRRVSGIGELLEAARHAFSGTVNALMTATYWEIGRRIVEFEQHGRQRAQYGEELLLRLSADLTAVSPCLDDRADIT
jgi:hypothetical protein